MHRTIAEVVQRIERRIDHERLPYVLIAAGVVYLAAFNTVLRGPSPTYFAFVLLVAVLCVPLLLHGPEPTEESEASLCGVALVDRE